MFESDVISPVAVIASKEARFPPVMVPPALISPVVENSEPDTRPPAVIVPVADMVPAVAVVKLPVLGGQDTNTGNIVT